MHWHLRPLEASMGDELAASTLRRKSDGSVTQSRPVLCYLSTQCCEMQNEALYDAEKRGDLAVSEQEQESNGRRICASCRRHAIAHHGPPSPARPVPDTANALRVMLGGTASFREDEHALGYLARARACFRAWRWDQR